jgi:pimeloyl-ACP methyl ester carboxylesterase
MIEMNSLKRAAIVLGVLIAVLLALGFHADRGAPELESRYARPPSQFVDVDGLRVHYRDRGSGPPLVLLHGSNSSLFTWEGWAERLAPTHRVVTLDLPGHGLTGPDPQGRYSAAAMAEWLDAFVTKIGLPRFALGGNSMGGSVAWHYALAHPERVEKLILVDSAGFPRREPRAPALRIASLPILGRVTRWETPRFAVAASVRDVYGDRSKATDDVIDRYYDLLLRDGNREATRERLSIKDDSLSARIGEIQAPTLILWGTEDRWILPKYGDQFRERIPGAKLVKLPGLGHVPMEEDPARSVAPVMAFL